MTSFLITGNMGYVGPCVVRHLRARFPNAVLKGLDNGYFAANLLKGEPLPECLLDEQHFADVRHAPAGLFDGVDAVVHLAAISNDPMGKAFEAVTAEINHRATVALAEAAKRAGVRTFVFASSCSVYGFAEDGARTENSSVNPLTAYARSKVACEQDLADLADENFVVTSLRFATACGASPRLRLDLVLNDFVASAIATGTVRILSDGTPWRPLIAVDDMARAIEWAATRPVQNGGASLVVNAGSGDWNYQVSQLAQAVARLIPGTTVDINRDAAPDKRSYRVDFSLFERLAPHHQPQSTLESTIAALRDALAAAEFRDADFRTSAYIRLNMLSRLIDEGRLNRDLFWESRAVAVPALA
jgi:nucleoside-diphosphate-sugar epimerase